MNDEYSVFPKEAFAPLGEVANNLIDKVSNAIGYVYIPKGKRKDRNDAVEYLIKEIKENKDMPRLAKAAAISNARKIIREYSNKNDILTIAIEHLSKDSKIDRLENDWLNNFFDKAGGISDKDVQILFGKILAEECANPGCVSKSLINILAIMDSGSAEAFRKLRNYIFTVIDAESINEKYVVMIPSVSAMNMKEIDVMFDDIVELTRLGLIEYLVIGQYSNDFGEVILKYAEKSIKIMPKDKGLPLGAVNLTRVGQELASLLVMEMPDYKYYDNIIRYWEEKGADVIKDFNV